MLGSPFPNSMIPSQPSTLVSMKPEPPDATVISITPFTFLYKYKSPSSTNMLNCESLLNPSDAPLRSYSPVCPFCLSPRLAVVFSNASTMSNKSVRKSTSR